MTDTYVGIEGRIAVVRMTSILFQIGKRSDWLPRAMLHPDDNFHIDAGAVGDTRTLRIAKTKADEIGLTPSRLAEGASRDLFSGDSA